MTEEGFPRGGKKKTKNDDKPGRSSEDKTPRDKGVRGQKDNVGVINLFGIFYNVQLIHFIQD